MQSAALQDQILIGPDDHKMTLSSSGQGETNITVLALFKQVTKKFSARRQKQ